MGEREKGMAAMTVEELREWSDNFERRMLVEPAVYAVEVRTVAKKMQVKIAMRWGMRLTPALRWFEFWVDAFGPALITEALNATARKLRARTLFPMDGEAVGRYTTGVLKSLADCEGVPSFPVPESIPDIAIPSDNQHEPAMQSHRAKGGPYKRRKKLVN
jgi:hypothetical protein